MMQANSGLHPHAVNTPPARVHELLIAAANLLDASAGLSRRALARAATGMVTAADVTVRIATLRQRMAVAKTGGVGQSSWLMELSRTVTLARFAARQATSAAMEIQAVIGGVNRPWQTPCVAPCLLDIEAGLEILLRQTREGAWRDFERELHAIETRVAAMLELARRHRGAAQEAADAAERASYLAIQFVRGVERSGLLKSAVPR